MNRKSFSIYLNKDKSFNITPFYLKKSFAINLNSKSIFTLIINGFNLIEKYKIRINNRFSVSFISKSIVKMNSNIEAGKYNFLINIRQGSGFFPNILNKIELILTPKENLKAQTIYSFISHLLVALKERLELFTSLVNLVIALSCNPEVRQYSTLSDYTSTELSTMDSQTLNELDYTIV
jgi:hypothetical protein